MAEGRISIRDRIQNAVARCVIGVALVLPYKTRVRLVGWIMSALIAPIAGWRARVRANLKQTVPELPKQEVERIVRGVCNNAGRALIEIYSGEEFLAHAEKSPFVGPGVAVFDACRASNSSMILLTAHIGNYDAVRGTLARQGLAMAALYKPMNNKAFNEHYVRAISAIGTPVFPLGGRGIIGLIRHLKGGGSIGVVGDVVSFAAPVLSFFGQPVHTPVSTAEWAVTYDVPLIPIFGLRNPDGFTFRLHVCEPIPHGTPEEMMQAYNDVVEAVVRENMDQWFWIHRRWRLKPESKSPSVI